jgi:hypothetical protein
MAQKTRFLHRGCAFCEDDRGARVTVLAEVLEQRWRACEKTRSAF